MVQLFFVISVIVIVYGAYFMIMGLFSFKKNSTLINKYIPSTRFAVIIPARNEEAVIGSLIDSLKGMNYPKELFDIYAVVNNCTDDTEMIARRKGAKIIPVMSDARCKGDVLKYAFSILGKKPFDAYIVFDADNVVHPGFLAEMNNIYKSGHRIAQGRKDTKNMGDSWISGSYSLFYNLQNYFYNKARTHIRATATINGTGFMVAKELVADGFDPKSVTEDIELSILALLKGHHVVYSDRAVTYDEQPSDMKTSWHQRKRWSKGIMQCTRLYSLKLLKNFFVKRDYSCLDKVLFMISPFMQLVALVPTALMLILAASGSMPETQGMPVHLSFLAGMIFSYGYTVALCLFTVIRYGQNIKESLPGVFMFIIFMLSWIPINIVCLKPEKNYQWIPVRHKRNVDLNVLTKGVLE